MRADLAAPARVWYSRYILLVWYAPPGHGAWRARLWEPVLYTLDSRPALEQKDMRHRINFNAVARGLAIYIRLTVSLFYSILLYGKVLYDTIY